MAVKEKPAAVTQMGAGMKGKSTTSAVKKDNNSDIFKEPWRYNRDGSRKTFDELTTPEVLTWISTLPENEQQSAAEEFERDYLKNPTSTRYDPYYTSYSNNDAARQMFGVDTFDQQWIDNNRGYAQYLTFTNESYTTPKKPGKTATRQEIEAYQWWQIANTYEETTQAAESEYSQLRSDVVDTIQAMRAAGETVSADAVIENIDWSDYKTLKNLREASAAGNGRMLNRPVQVGDESIKSMVSAAIRGEDVTEDKDWVMGESEYIKNRPTTVQSAIGSGVALWLMMQTTAVPMAKNELGMKDDARKYSDVTSVDYDPYYGEGSNNNAARELFGVEQFDQEWMDNNRGLMEHITFKDEDDLTPVKPGEDASAEEKKAYQYWLIANTYEETTREGEKELEQLQKWMQRRADYLGEGATAQEIVDGINWEDYPTLENMRATAAVGNARMVNRPVHAGDESLMEMAREITGETEADGASGTAATGGTGSLIAGSQKAQIAALDELINSLPEDSEEREKAEKERDGLRMQLEGVSEEAAAEGNRLAGRGLWLTFSRDAKSPTEVTQEFKERVSELPNSPFREKGDNWEATTAEENKAKAQAALASLQAAEARSEAGKAGALSDYQERILTEVYGSTETQAVESAGYNDYVGSMRAQYGLAATTNWIKRQIAQMEIGIGTGEELGGMTEEMRAQYDALIGEYEQQLSLLKDEQTQRALIEKSVYEDLREAGYWGVGPGAFLKNRDFKDAKNDGDKVPLEDYEAYLQYRMTPGTLWGDEVLSVRPEMAKYDQTGEWQDRANLAISAVEEGTKSVGDAMGFGAAEHVMYWIKSKLPEYQGLTREEIYAIDSDLQDLRAWNQSFEGSMDEEERARLNQEYPVFSMVTAGITEIMKMGYQSAVGGAIGNAVGDVVEGVQRMTGLGGHQIEGIFKLASSGEKLSGWMKRIGSYVPFGLDSYSSSFETAINEGATTDQAMLAGVLNGALSGTLSGWMSEQLTETGKSLFGRLFKSKAAQQATQKGLAQAAKNGLGNTLLSLLGTAAGEGFEEGLEEIISGGISKAVYDRDKAWTGEGGVIDPKAIMQSALSGALVGGAYPVVSGAGAAVRSVRADKATAKAEKKRRARIERAAQRIFELTGSYSGELGEAAKAKADSIMERIANGEKIDESEFDELQEIAARNASIEDAAEALIEERRDEIDAAREEAVRAEETAQEAEGKASEALAEYDGVREGNKPLLKALNEGTMSYDDPEAVKKIAERLTETKAARGKADAASSEAKNARETADAAAQEAADTENRIRTEARAQATEQVDSEMAQEKTERQTAEAEVKRQRQIRPEGETQPGVREMYSGKLSRDQRTQLRILDALGREYGIEFDIVDTLGGGISAMYDRSQSKVITVALDASEQAYVQAGTHEMVHYIKAEFEDGYTNLEAVVLRALKKNGVDDAMLEYMIKERMEQYQERTGREMTREDALEEIVAETVPTVFADEDAMAELVSKHRTLVEALRDFFVEFSAKLRKIAERYMERNSRIEMGSVLNDAESLREIAERLNDALDAAAVGQSDLSKTDYKKTGNAQKAASGEDVKYAIDSFANGRAYDYETLISKPDMQVAVIPNKGNGTTRAEVIEIGVERSKEIGSINENGNAVIYVDDLGSEVIVGKNGIKHGLDRRFEDQAAVAENVGQILKNAVVINEADPENANATDMYVLLGCARTQAGELRIVRFVVNRFRGELTDFDVLYSAYGKKNRAGSLKDEISGANSPASTDSKISIAELLGNVNGLFDDVISKDTADNLGIERSRSKFTDRLRYSLTEGGESVSDGDADEEIDHENTMPELDGVDYSKYINESESGGFEEFLKRRYGKIGRETDESNDSGKKGKEKSLAGKLVRKYKSDVDRSRVRAALAEIEDAYNNGEAEEAEEAAAKIAREIAEKSRSAGNLEDAEEAAKRERLREQYGETRKMLRKTGISLTEVQKQEIVNQYGSYNEWRRSMMGNVLIKNDAKSLDAVWGELSEMHPEMFPPDTNEAQMPEVLARFIEQVRPAQKAIDGMDAGSMAAAISLEIQSEVLSAIGKEADSVSAQMAAEAIKDKGRKRTALKREAQREARRAVMQEIAAEIRAARDSRDDAAIAAALAKYREKMGEALASRPAEIITLGMDIRAKEQEISRLQRQLDLLQEETGIEDLSDDLEASIRQKEVIEDQIKSAKQSLREMHRQQMIERSRSRLRDMDADETDADPMQAMAEEVAREDLKERIEQMKAESRQQIAAFNERMRTRQADYSQISTLRQEDIDEFFGEMSGELAQNSELARDFDEHVSGWQYQLEDDEQVFVELKRELAEARQDGDLRKIEEISQQVDQTRDRIDVLKSRIKQGKADAQYYRRMGAQNVQKALREGRIAQPIMERVIAMCADAQRKNNWFNKLALVKSGAEATRLNWTTAARVWDDLFGDAAPVMRAIYYDPVMDNETERQKWMRDWREKIAALKLTDEESRLVQLIGEGRADKDTTENASQRVLDAIEVFRSFYDEAYELASNAMVRNGYSKPGHRGKYFPHIDKPNSFWEKIGIPLEDSSLPTSINGLTETFSPGRQYSGHMQKREGYTTADDALYGFEEYLSSMSNVIYHTDDIQRHRQLESEIRAAAANGVFEGGAGTTHLSEFVKWIHEYTNLLAGKKSQIDRGAESTLGRPIYRTIMATKSVKGASAVCGNIASAITNFIPIQQVSGEHPAAFVKAVWQCFFESAVSKSNLATSSYIVRRFGSDSVVETKYSRFTKGASWLFDKVDHITTNAVVYTYYHANMDMGMDSETAMRSADSKAARLMGDRSKGAMPNVYGSQLAGLLTQFQYEVANQSQHFRKDIWRGKSGKNAWWTLIGTMITGHVWNTLSEWLTGRRSAADPIQMGFDMWDAWVDKGSPMAIAQAAYNNVSDMFPYMGGGRIAAFEGFSDVIEAATTEGNTGMDVLYSLGQLGMGLVPMGGQIKKTVRGIWALGRGGYYNPSGAQLQFAVDQKNAGEIIRALIFGPTGTASAVSYYNGESSGLRALYTEDAPGLSKSSTEAYEQARSRGYSNVEAYKNEADKAKAARLEKDADKIEKESEDALARLRQEGKGENATSISEVESQRAEAQALRSEVMPGDKLSDYWWQRRDEKSVQAGIELWRQTGETWALPVSYDENTRFEIDYPEFDIENRPEYLDKQLAEEANRMYAEGYAEIMSGVNAVRLDEEGRKALRNELSKLKSKVDAWAKEELASVRGA